MVILIFFNLIFHLLVSLKTKCTATLNNDFFRTGFQKLPQRLMCSSQRSHKRVIFHQESQEKSKLPILKEMSVPPALPLFMLACWVTALHRFYCCDKGRGQQRSGEERFSFILQFTVL